MTDPDVSDVERLLHGRPCPEPPAELGPRIFAACRTALDEPRQAAWGWAVAAALVLLLANLSMSLATATDWHLGPGVESSMSDQARALALDLPETELRRQALLRRAAADLPLTVALTGMSPRISQELDRWDMH